MYNRSVISQLKLYVRVHKSHAFKLAQYMVHLHLIAFQKLTTGGNIVKQVFNHKIASMHTTLRLLTQHS